MSNKSKGQTLQDATSSEAAAYSTANASDKDDSHSNLSQRMIDSELTLSADTSKIENVTASAISSTCLAWPRMTWRASSMYSPLMNRMAYPHCSCSRNIYGQCRRFTGWWKRTDIKTTSRMNFYYDILNCLKPILKIPLEKAKILPGICWQSYVSTSETSLPLHNSTQISENMLNKPHPCSAEIEHLEIPASHIILGSSTCRAIGHDIARTFNSMKLFRTEASHQLKRILEAYAFYDPKVGYVQGMGLIAAALLWHSNELQAFWMLVAMMELYDLRCMFEPKLPGVFKRSHVVRILLQMFEPVIFSHLESFGVELEILASDWLLTLFSYTLPMDALDVLWDLFFANGWIVIYKLIIQRIKSLRKELMEVQDIANFMIIVKHSTRVSPSNSIGHQLKRYLKRSTHGMSPRSKSKNGHSQEFSTIKKNETSGLSKLWLHLIEASQSLDIDHSFIFELEKCWTPQCQNNEVSKFGSNTDVQAQIETSSSTSSFVSANAEDIHYTNLLIYADCDHVCGAINNSLLNDNSEYTKLGKLISERDQESTDKLSVEACKQLQIDHEHLCCADPTTIQSVVEYLGYSRLARNTVSVFNRCTDFRHRLRRANKESPHLLALKPLPNRQ